MPSRSPEGDGAAFVREGTIVENLRAGLFVLLDAFAEEHADAELELCFGIVLVGGALLDGGEIESGHGRVAVNEVAVADADLGIRIAVVLGIDGWGLRGDDLLSRLLLLGPGDC